MKRLQKVIQITIVLACVGRVPLIAQVDSSRTERRLPPLPVFPKDDILSSEQEKQYLFLDPDSGELVLSYPESLFGQGVSGQPGRRVTQRIMLAISTAPVLKATVSDSVGGELLYEYNLGNRTGALQPIAKFVLALDDLKSVIDTAITPGWGLDRFEPRSDREENRLDVMAITGTAEERADNRARYLRTQLRWWVRAEQGLIQAGGAPVRFALTSSWKPGLITSYVQGLPYKMMNVPPLPEVVAKAIGAFNFVEKNSLSLPTIGPRFSPDTSQSAIATDFLDRLGLLIQKGHLSSNSTYLKELEPVLRELATPGEAGAGPPRRVGAAPENVLEEEIAVAVRVSLGITAP
ncbi:MAG: hypothetical protein ACE15E_23930 [Acidobacteriota bacterium]